MYNVIQNAIEASPKNETVKVNSKVSNDVLRISVSDRGEGIGEEIRSRIFEPFFTTKADTPRAGLGLGLSISKGMAEAMGGTIEFRSNVGKGTVFEVALPLGSRKKEEW